MMPKHVLDGFKVLDLSQYLAGPAVTRLMAEMGAEIIKVEFQPNGDPSRSLPMVKEGRSAYYVQQNRGKKSLCVDLKHPKTLEILKGLIAKCDVLLENFAPRVIERLGLGWDEVHKINPEIVMCSISAFGQTGPIAELPGFDYIAQAYAAVTDMIGEPDRPPSLPALAMGDIGTGVHALAAINAALLDRTRTGKGQHLDISLLDSYFHLHELNVQVYSASGGQVLPRRGGSQHYAVSPIGIFRGKTSNLLIIALLHQWEGLCKLIGREDMITDPKFATNEARVENNDEVIAVLEGWIKDQPDDDDARRQLEEARIPVAPVLTVPEAMEHPQLVERNTIRTIKDRILGEFKIPGMPLRFSAYPDLLPLEAPFLGENNADVLSEYLGYSADDIAALEGEGVLSSKDT